MGKDTSPKPGTAPLDKGSDEAAQRARQHHEEEPLQARGPDPRDEARSDVVSEEAHGKAVGGVHHDETPPVLVKQAHQHKEMEKGRPKDTGRAGA